MARELLVVGQLAPAFEGIDQHGKNQSLANYEGKKVALYFYPRDSTPTCTVEACNLRDNFSELTNLGVQIIGVSADDEASHLKFSNKHQLPFPLIADTDKTILNQYGVWGEKKFMGKVFDGIHRTTYLIDEEGRIAHVIEKVKSKEHAQQIIDIWGLH